MPDISLEFDASTDVSKVFVAPPPGIDTGASGTFESIILSGADLPTDDVAPEPDEIGNQLKVLAAQLNPGPPSKPPAPAKSTARAKPAAPPPPKQTTITPTKEAQLRPVSPPRQSTGSGSTGTWQEVAPPRQPPPMWQEVPTSRQPQSPMWQEAASPRQEEAPIWNEPETVRPASAPPARPSTPAARQIATPAVRRATPASAQAQAVALLAARRAERQRIVEEIAADQAAAAQEIPQREPYQEPYEETFEERFPEQQVTVRVDRRQHAKSRPRPTLIPMTWGTGVAAIALLFFLQVVHHFRQDLATNDGLRAPLTNFYRAFGVTLLPRWDLAAYEVRQLGALAGAGNAGQLTVRVSVKNGAKIPQPLPLLRVTVQDRFGNRVATRDVPASVYAPVRATQSPEIPAGDRVDGEISFVDPGQAAVGFEIDACLMNERGRTACTNDQIGR